ncbi:MAG: hypothetical protein QXU21_05795 [Candidatus Bathyarchaeia archaeon]
MKNCPHQKTDNKDLPNCTRGENHIGLCQNPCPYVYEATSSASNQKCSTSVDKLVSSRVRRKRQAESPVKPSKNVLHFNIEAEGVEIYA